MRRTRTLTIGGIALLAVPALVPMIGLPIPLPALLAAVVGGELNGPVMGALTLGVIQNIISFAHINTWWETFVKAIIIVIALAMPGIISLFRRRE